MALEKAPITAMPINNPGQAIQSIEYIENQVNGERYRRCKEVLMKKSDLCAKEILLFHGTNVQNIDSILNANFNIESSPVDRCKAMVYGRGVYMSEFPGVSLMYGNGLLLCKVLLGSIETVSMADICSKAQSMVETFDTREVVKDGVTVMHVIKNSDQILPYCVINLQNIPDNSTPGGAIGSGGTKGSGGTMGPGVGPGGTLFPGGPMVSVGPTVPVGPCMRMLGLTVAYGAIVWAGYTSGLVVGSPVFDLRIFLPIFLLAILLSVCLLCQCCSSSCPREEIRVYNTDTPDQLLVLKDGEIKQVKD